MGARSATVDPHKENAPKLRTSARLKLTSTAGGGGEPYSKSISFNEPPASLKSFDACNNQKEAFHDYKKTNFTTINITRDRPRDEAAPARLHRDD